MTLQELKPCPFCGGSGEVINRPDYDFLFPCIVRCGDCGVRTKGDVSDHIAVNTWNRRGAGRGDGGTAMNTCENCKHYSKRSMECRYKPPTTIRYQLGYIGTDYFPSVPVEPDWTCDAWLEMKP